MKTYSMQELKDKNTTQYKFSSRSLNNLIKIDRELVDVVFKVSEHIDLKIIQGYRTPEEQNALYRRRRSTKDGYRNKSKHQSGLALDILPLPRGVNMYRTNKENNLRWAYFVGFFQGVATQANVKIKCGWKWRTLPQRVIERNFRSNTFVDSNHFEIIK